MRTQVTKTKTGFDATVWTPTMAGMDRKTYSLHLHQKEDGTWLVKADGTKGGIYGWHAVGTVGAHTESAIHKGIRSGAIDLRGIGIDPDKHITIGNDDDTI